MKKNETTPPVSKNKLTIDDLLEALTNPKELDEEQVKGLSNTAEIWARIGSKDPSLADEIGISTSELDAFLATWVEENPYSNI